MANCTDYVLVSALKERMKEKDLNQITVTELVEITRMNRKTFYHHFSGMADLVCYTIREGFKKTVVGRVEPYVWDAALKDFLYEVKRNEEFVKKVLESKYASEVRLCFKKDLGKEITAYVKSSKLLLEQSDNKKIELNSCQERSLVKFYVAMISSFVEEWITDGMEEPIEEYAEIVKRLSGNGIAAGISFYTGSKERD